MIATTKQLYNGPPIHTVTIFANPFLDNKPSLDDGGVLYVSPGEMPPEEGTWHTLYFLPGLHDIGHSFTVHRDKSYYILGDAVVYDTMDNMEWGKAANATIFGHGETGRNCPIQHFLICQRMSIVSNLKDAGRDNVTKYEVFFKASLSQNQSVPTFSV